jgi:hypothetical protein
VKIVPARPPVRPHEHKTCVQSMGEIRDALCPPHFLPTHNWWACDAHSAALPVTFARVPTGSAIFSEPFTHPQYVCIECVRPLMSTRRACIRVSSLVETLPSFPPTALATHTFIVDGELLHECLFIRYQR